ncbi:MAG TPA: NERD domain-containing protein, partial [Thermodesulfovibrionia bacterium]|nr:NERD domain-containing protein [Thermodesulfovibrionia bacterium]
MARMIPPYISPSCPSPGEQEIFRRLKKDPETSSWIVLHSLDIADHVRQISGEADFVVIIPAKGVLCLEVKACSSLRRENGQWFYGLETRPDARGPFRQASEAMHSIRKRVIEKRPDLSHIVFWSAVIFPFVEFSVRSEEWHPWQVVDSRAFRARPLWISLLGILEKASSFLQERLDLKWFHPQSDSPNEEQCNIVMNLLRPSFEFYESPKQQALKLSNELKYYTQEQFAALDAMEANPRVAFSGPAGTGKTILAIEAARRSVLKGNRVLFVCFNRLLGKWLEDQTESLKPQLVTKTLHRHMLKIADIVTNETEKLQETFWTEKLPVFATDKILMEGGLNCFDEIIVDEAQDILRNEYLDFLDLSLEGGLASGQWRFFGDFEKQVIFGAANIPLDVFIKNRSGSASIYTLRMNCRNTPRI